MVVVAEVREVMVVVGRQEREGWKQQGPSRLSIELERLPCAM